MTITYNRYATIRFSLDKKNPGDQLMCFCVYGLKCLYKKYYIFGKNKKEVVTNGFCDDNDINDIFSNDIFYFYLFCTDKSHSFLCRIASVCVYSFEIK